MAVPRLCKVLHARRCLFPFHISNFQLTCRRTDGNIQVITQFFTKTLLIELTNINNFAKV